MILLYHKNAAEFQDLLRMLTHLGYSVYPTEDFDKAIATYANAKCRIVVTCLGSTRETGVKFLTKTQTMGPTPVRVVYMDKGEKLSEAENEFFKKLNITQIVQKEDITQGKFFCNSNIFKPIHWDRVLPIILTQKAPKMTMLIVDEREDFCEEIQGRFLPGSQPSPVFAHSDTDIQHRLSFMEFQYLFANVSCEKIDTAEILIQMKSKMADKKKFPELILYSTMPLDKKTQHLLRKVLGAKKILMPIDHGPPMAARLIYEFATLAGIGVSSAEIKEKKGDGGGGAPPPKAA